MMLSTFYQEIMAAHGEPPATTETKGNEVENAKCLKEIPKPGSLSENDIELPEVRSNVSSFWASSKSIEALRKLQSEDPDIGPIVAAKLEGKRPSSQDMVTYSPATRHYWILWDSLSLQECILLKKFLKQDGAGKYL